MRGRKLLQSARHLAALSALALAAPSLADNYAFDNQLPTPGGSSWHAGQGTSTTNWAPEGIPGAADNAFIDGFNVVIGLAPVTVAQLNTTGGSLTVGQDLTINNSGAIANLHLGRNLIANGPVSVLGNSDWNLGTISGAGGVTNAGTFTTRPPGAGNVITISNTTFINAGTFNNNAAFSLNNANFRNNGTFNAIANITNVANGVFTNHGNLTTSANPTIGVLLANGEGSVSASGAAANLNINNGSNFLGGNITVADEGSVNLTGGAEHLIGGHINLFGAGTIQLNGTIRVNGSLNNSSAGSRGLFLNGGSIVGSGAVSNSSQILWEGTTISNTGGLVNNLGATLTLGSVFNHTVNSLVENYGTTNHVGRTLVLNSTGTFENQLNSTYRVNSTSALGMGGFGTFNNRGNLLKFNSNQLAIDVVFNSFPGSIMDIQQGSVLLTDSGRQQGSTFAIAQGATLHFQNNYTFVANNRFEGQGTVLLTELLSFNTAGNVFNMQGTGVAHLTDNTNAMVMFLRAPVENHGNFRITGSPGIDADGDAGKFINSVGANLDIFNTPLISAPLENLGTVNQQANSSIRIDTGGVITNKRNWNVSSGTITTNGIAPHTFTNDGGTFKKSGASNFTFDLLVNNQGGIVEIEGVEGVSSSFLILNRGGVHGGGVQYRLGSRSELQLLQSHTAVGDVNFSQAGIVYLEGTYTAVSGTTTFDNASGLIINDLSAVLSGTAFGQIVLNTRTDWRLGTLAGGAIDAQGNVTGGIVNNSNIILGTSGASTRRLTGVLQHTGQFTHHTGNLELAGGIFINTGTYTIHDNTTVRAIATSAGGRFINRGQFFSTGENVIQAPFDFNSGSVTVHIGTLSFSSGGNSIGSGVYQASDQIVFNGGIHSFDGSYEASGDSDIRLTGGEIRGDLAVNLASPAAFVIAGGTINGPAGHAVINRGQARFEAGQIIGPDGLFNFGELRIPNISAGRIISGRLSNADYVIQDGGLTLTGVIRNQMDADWQISGSINGAGGFFDNQGDVSAFPASITVTSRFNNQGTLDVGLNSNLTLSGPVDQFNPTAGSLTGGTWIIHGRLTLGSNQTIKLLDANVTILGTGVLTNLSTVEFENAGNLTFFGQHNFSQRVKNTGDLQIPIGSSLTAPNLTNTGTLCGGGRVNGTLTNEGIACAGQSPGILTIAGNFIQSASGSIQTEIAGTTVGIEYDQISITGPATLAGNLDLVLLGNYAPTPYTPFTILTATSITGIFDTITGADAGNGFSFATIYHPNRVEVMAVLPGDLNLDQQVSIADFIQLASNFNATDATWSDGDINGDGSVSIADFIGLASNFNSVYVPPIGPAAALSASSAAVPEPAMTALLLSLAPFLRRRRFSLLK